MRSNLSRFLVGGLAVATLASTFSIIGCAGGYVTNRLTEPIGDGMLIIGSVIVENVGYRQRREFYTSDIEISIMADQVVDGEMVRKNISLFAEKDGYFCVENIPQGRYTLKGVRIFSPGGDWTIWNELRMPNERWAVGPAEYRYAFTGEYFHFTPVDNVYNFMHNIFSVAIGGDAYYANRPRLRGEAFYLADTYTRGFVEEYFIDKFPDSGWTPILRELLPDIPPE
jgi:hypothetical protein